MSELHNKLRWGIISTGNISGKFCAAITKITPPNLHKITAVGARKFCAAKRFGELFEIDNCYGSYDQVCLDPNVDIVYVGVINNIHHKVCLTAIENGKHVLCEKPMTMTAIQTREVVEAARKRGVFLMEGLWTRFFPIIERLRHEIRENSIGEIRFVNANFFIPMMDIDSIRSKEFGGGVLMNIGCYPIQLVCMLFNHEKPLSIVASGHLTETGI